MPRPDNLIENIASASGSYRVDLSGAPQLQCEAIVRLVPGRRLVCRGSWDGRPVYAKLFFGSKAGRDAGRDASGVHALTEAGIATPELLFDGNIANGGGRVLVFAEVTGSSAEVVWRTLAHDPAARLDLVKRLVQTVAKHHLSGLIQHDLYLKNFLVTEAAVFTLDGDGIRCHAAPLGRRTALDNLALLLSKFDAVDDPWLPQVQQHYAAALGMALRPAEIRTFPARVMAHRLRVARSYADHKVFRTCTDVIIEHRWNSYKAIARPQDSEELRALLDNPEARLREANVRILKNGNTCTVLALPLKDRNIVVKRYNIKNFWHGLGRAWRPSRAAASWANAYRMNILGIPTAQPLALLERRWGSLRRQAYYVAEYVDATDATAFFADPAVSAERKQYAVQNISRLLHKLWCLGLVHGDMKATNVLIGAEEQPLLLDLDAMRAVRCKWILRRGHGRDLSRWMENWRNDPLTAEMMRQALEQVYQNDKWLRELLSV
ncbi:MAG TPA: lipopolysaccharide kinase InaA family protein [Methylophilaceae bacterium]|nr:lipopolysaccharide kinase InaA family protein [Methylophilaceae bacterium]HQR60077.1 lipopolysaccharide kinase InaA family protein [Methylophilaceae bacterium]